MTRVAIYVGEGAPFRDADSLRCIFDTGDRPLETVIRGAEELTQGSLDDVAVVVFPGGSGNAQAEALGTCGRDAVKDFVRTGGGFLGIAVGRICACHTTHGPLAFSTRLSLPTIRAMRSGPRGYGIEERHKKLLSS